jgi:Flp pilus assembly protein TadD
MPAQSGQQFLERIMMSLRLRMILALATMTVISGCSAPRPTEAVRESGEWRFKAGRYDEARDEYAEIVSRFPGDWDAQYKLGLSMMKTGELAGARRAIETAHSLKPENREVAAALAEVMDQQNDDDRLFAYLRERASSSQSVEDYLMMAHYMMEKDPDTAQTAIATAIQLDDGKTTQPYIDAAKLDERLGHLEDAVRRLRQAYGINPNDMRVRERLKAMGEDPNKVTPLPPGR